MTGRPDRRPLGAVTRRRFLQVGGTLSMAAALAACIGGGSSKQSRDSSGGAGSRRADATITRTFSSVEAVAVVVYTTALDSGLLTTPAVADLAKRFRSHHQEHAALFVGTARDLGSAPFTDPNPIVMQQVQPVLDGLRDEVTAVNLALDVETILADTYQATMGTFADKSFNVAAMSVGGAEARHAAALAQALGVPPVPQAFEATDRAVAAGNGV
jgi:Ferritin-like domain